MRGERCAVAEPQETPAWGMSGELGHTHWYTRVTSARLGPRGSQADKDTPQSISED